MGTRVWMRWWTVRLGAIAAAVIVTETSARADHVKLDYAIVTNGQENGRSSVQLAAPGRVHIENRYQSQDKTRTLTVDVTLSAAGVPTAMRRLGQAFAFQPIDETFDTVGGRVRWINRIERSEASGGGYYVPLGLNTSGDSAAYELGLLAAAALRAGPAGVPLLPVGRARAAVLRTETVGRERVRLIALDGLGLEPEYLWLDANDRMFAARGTIRDVAKAELPRLDAIRREMEAARVREAVDELPKVSKALLFHDVAVFDADHARIVPRRDVLIADGKVSWMHSTGTPVPLDTRIIDGRGRTLLPGLWDMHVHLSGAREALRHLATGVTTVRDMGNDNSALDGLVAALGRGELPGPTVLRAGFIEGTGPSATYLGRLVGSEAEAVAAVGAYADAGFPQIKLYNQVRPEWVGAIAREAHARGLRLSGHIPFGGTADRAVADGYDEIQHWIFLYLNFADGPVTTGLTFKAAAIARDLDLGSPAFTAFVDQLRARGTVLDLTFAVYEPLLTGAAGHPAPAFAAWAGVLPPAFLRQVATGPLPTPPSMTRAEFAGTLGRAMALVPVLRRAGVPLVAGTDFLPLAGLTLPRELELMVAAGLTPAETLRIATLGAARVMRHDRDTGAIEPGKTADLLLVRGDPTRDIARVRDVDLVVKAGIPYAPRDLLAASGLGR